MRISDPVVRHETIERILGGLKELRLTYLMASLKEKLEDPEFELRNPITVMDELITAECDRRRSNRFQGQLRKAELKYPTAALDEALYDPERKLDTALLNELSQCGWMNEHKNVIITGMTGAGKTHVACALAVRALTQRRTARYGRAGVLLREMASAEADGTLQALLDTLKKIDLLVIDDFGLHKFDVDECRNLFELIDARDCVKSTIIVSQIPVGNWYEMFSNATYAEAVLDRITSKSYRIEMSGASMRRK